MWLHCLCDQIYEVDFCYFRLPKPPRSLYTPSCVWSALDSAFISRFFSFQNDPLGQQQFAELLLEDKRVRSQLNSTSSSFRQPTFVLIPTQKYPMFVASSFQKPNVLSSSSLSPSLSPTTSRLSVSSGSDCKAGDVRCKHLKDLDAIVIRKKQFLESTYT